MENMQQESICKNCSVKEDCSLEKHQRMYKGKCYIDVIASKIGKSKLQVIRLMNEFMYETGYGTTVFISRFQDIWYKLDERKKTRMIHDDIVQMQEKKKNWFPEYKPCDERTNKYCALIVAILNTHFDTWRNEDYVRCLRCGEVFKNNKQHNRKYCNKCRGYQRLGYKELICPDCGEDFLVQTPNNRQFRCLACQKDADKIAAAQRAKRYRERKSHGIN